MRAWLTDRGALQLKRGEHAMIREVLLRDGAAPLVFAHSVVALRDLHGAWRGLSRLGSRPLAEMLFKDPLVSRLPMQYKKLDARHPRYRRAARACGALPTHVWARRSVFLRGERPLLVSEVFTISS